jgi:arylsulfatase A-like enzyme
MNLFWGFWITMLVTTALNSQGRPNIVFIMSDDHAYQAISAYGHGLNNTPHIDQLAKEGILFRNAFVTNSLCAPSRAAILTGKYSHLNGIKGNGVEKFDGSQPTFPKLLQTAGYQTALIGKWHLESDPTGFDYWNILPGQGDYYNPDFIEMGTTNRVEGYVTDLTMDKALEWLQRRDSTKPFCLLVWNKAPHRNWMPSVKYLQQFRDTDLPLPTSFFDNYQFRSRAAREQKMEISKWLRPNYDLKLNFVLENEKDILDKSWKRIFGRLNAHEKALFEDAYMPENKFFKQSLLNEREIAIWKYQRYMKDYLRCVQSVDDNVGRMTAFLQANGLDKNTIVVYTSDQGFYLGEHGWFDKRFMYEPSFKTPLLIKWPAEIRKGTVNSNLVMNIDLPMTLLDAAGIKSPKSMQGESILSLVKSKNEKKGRKSIYYHYYESGDEHNVAKHIGVRTKSYKLIWYYENKEWELYDIAHDPNEMNNLYDRSDFSKMRSQLHIELVKLAKQYKDEEMVHRIPKNSM